MPPTKNLGRDQPAPKASSGGENIMRLNKLNVLEPISSRQQTPKRNLIGYEFRPPTSRQQAREISPAALAPEPPPAHELAQCYEEIDQIYDYIRGLAQLPPSLRKIKSIDFEQIERDKFRMKKLEQFKIQDKVAAAAAAAAASSKNHDNSKCSSNSSSANNNTNKHAINCDQISQRRSRPMRPTVSVNYDNCHLAAAARADKRRQSADVEATKATEQKVPMSQNAVPIKVVTTTGESKRPSIKRVESLNLGAARANLPQAADGKQVVALRQVGHLNELPVSLVPGDSQFRLPRAHSTTIITPPGQRQQPQQNQDAAKAHMKKAEPRMSLGRQLFRLMLDQSGGKSAARIDDLVCDFVDADEGASCSSSSPKSTPQTKVRGHKSTQAEPSDSARSQSDYENDSATTTTSTNSSEHENGENMKQPLESRQRRLSSPSSGRPASISCESARRSNRSSGCVGGDDDEHQESTGCSSDENSHIYEQIPAQTKQTTPGARSIDYPTAQMSTARHLQPARGGSAATRRTPVQSQAQFHANLNHYNRHHLPNAKQQQHFQYQPHAHHVGGHVHSLPQPARARETRHQHLLLRPLAADYQPQHRMSMGNLHMIPSNQPAPVAFATLTRDHRRPSTAIAFGGHHQYSHHHHQVAAQFLQQQQQQQHHHHHQLLLNRASSSGRLNKMGAIPRAPKLSPAQLIGQMQMPRAMSKRQVATPSHSQVSAPDAALVLFARHHQQPTALVGSLTRRLKDPTRPTLAHNRRNSSRRLTAIGIENELDFMRAAQCLSGQSKAIHLAEAPLIDEENQTADEPKAQLAKMKKKSSVNSMSDLRSSSLTSTNDEREDGGCAADYDEDNEKYRLFMSKPKVKQPEAKVKSRKGLSAKLLSGERLLSLIGLDAIGRSSQLKEATPRSTTKSSDGKSKSAATNAEENQPASQHHRQFRRRSRPRDHLEVTANQLASSMFVAKIGQQNREMSCKRRQADKCSSKDMVEHDGNYKPMQNDLIAHHEHTEAQLKVPSNMRAELKTPIQQSNDREEASSSYSSSSSSSSSASSTSSASSSVSEKDSNSSTSSGSTRSSTSSYEAAIKNGDLRESKAPSSKNTKKQAGKTEIKGHKSPSTSTSYSSSARRPTTARPHRPTNGHTSSSNGLIKMPRLSKQSHLLNARPLDGSKLAALSNGQSTFMTGSILRRAKMMADRVTPSSAATIKQTSVVGAESVAGSRSKSSISSHRSSSTKEDKSPVSTNLDMEPEDFKRLKANDAAHLHPSPTVTTYTSSGISSRLTAGTHPANSSLSSSQRSGSSSYRSANDRSQRHQTSIGRRDERKSKQSEDEARSLGVESPELLQLVEDEDQDENQRASEAASNLRLFDERFSTKYMDHHMASSSDSLLESMKLGGGVRKSTKVK